MYDMMPALEQHQYYQYQKIQGSMLTLLQHTCKETQYDLGGSSLTLQTHFLIL